MANNVIKTTNHLQGIGLRKQLKLLLPAIDECVSLKEEIASLLMPLALNFTSNA